MQRLPSGLAIVTPDDKVVPRDPSKLRWVNYSKEKRGKTTFGMGIPGALLIDVECKADLVDSPSAHYAQVRSLKEFDALIDHLCSKKQPYSMVVLDTIDELLYGLVIPGFTKELQEQLRAAGKGVDFTDIREYGSSGQGSRGWDMVTNRVLSYLRRLTQAGYAWMVMGHVKERQINIRQPDGRFQQVNVERPAIPDGIRMGLARMGEVFGEFAWEDVNTATQQVCIANQWVTRTPEHDARITAGERILTRTQNESSRSLVLRIAERSGDSGVAVGSNVRALPPRVILPLGSGWESVMSAYKELREAQEKSNA